MAAAERLNILMTPDEKPGLEAMLEALAESHRGTIAALERAEAELAETRRHFAARRATEARPEPAGI